MKKSTDRSSLFLMELVIDLFLFVLCAAVCVVLLVHARSMSGESTRLTQAVYLAQSAAEEWKATGETPVWRGGAGDGLSGSFELRDGALYITILQEDGTPIYSLEGVKRVE